MSAFISFSPLPSGTGIFTNCCVLKRYKNTSSSHAPGDAVDVEEGEKKFNASQKHQNVSSFKGSESPTSEIERKKGEELEKKLAELQKEQDQLRSKSEKLQAEIQRLTSLNNEMSLEAV